MGIFSKESRASASRAFNAKKGLPKLVEGLSSVVRRALLGAALLTAPTSAHVDLKGTILFQSFKPEPQYTSVVAAPVANDNAAAAVVPSSPVFAARFFDPAHVRVVLPAAVSANDVAAPVVTPHAVKAAHAAAASPRREMPRPDKKPAAVLAKEFANEAVVMTTPVPKYKGGKLKLKEEVKIKVDVSMATGLTRNSSLSAAQAVFQRTMQNDPAPAAPVQAERVEKRRVASNPRHDEIMAAFKRDLALAVAQQEAEAGAAMPVPQPEKVAPLPGAVKHIYNLSSAGVPSAVQNMRPEVPQQPSRQAQNVRQQRAPRVA
jgi:hypothetical protein